MDPNLTTKPKPSRSFVWDHFEKSECRQWVSCKICHSTLKYCGNTSNLRNHLKGKHDILEFGTVDRSGSVKRPRKTKTAVAEEQEEEESIIGDYEIQDDIFEETIQADEEDDALIPEFLDEQEIIVEEIDDFEELEKSETNELVCRICLSHALSEYITEYHEHDIQAQVINECTGINIDEPGTLNTICYTCVTAIRSAQNLRLTALESDATLKERKLLKAKAETEPRPKIEVINFYEQVTEDVIMSLPDQTTVHQVLVEPGGEMKKPGLTTKRLTVKKLAPKLKRPLKTEEDEDIFDDEPLSNWQIVDETTKNTIDRSKNKRKQPKLEERVKKKYPAPPLVCEICAKVCRGKRFLEEHMNTHTGAREKVREPRPRPRKQFKAVCDICAKVLLSKANFIEHMNAHNNLKTRQCPYCSMAFCYRNSLARHILTHSGAKPKKCDQCSNSYRTTSHLKTHKLMAHGSASDRKYGCNICGKAFVQNFQLNAHLKEHAKHDNNASDSPKMKLSYKVFITPDTHDAMYKFEEVEEEEEEEAD